MARPSSAEVIPFLRFLSAGARRRALIVAAMLVAFAVPTTSAVAQQLGYAEQPGALWSDRQALGSPGFETESDDASVVPARLQRAIVPYQGRQAPGTIIIDTRNTQLYYVLADHRAVRYGVGVGREGFTWSGVENVSRKVEWPDWIPPAEMIARQPYLPRFMAGGPGNPLGAAAMYLGASMYRIHGTNDPSTIGKFVSSGCIRLTNEDVKDLFSRVHVGTRVVVLPKSGSSQFEANSAAPGKVVPTSASRGVIAPTRVSQLH